MLDRRPSARVVALVMSLRRSAEHDAQRQFEEAKTNLELERAHALVLLQRLARAEQEACPLAEERGERGPMAAACLRGAQEILLRRREECQAARIAAERGARSVAQALRLAEGFHRRWLWSIARREAVQRHEHNERRERARFRLRRAEANEAETIQRHRP